MSMGASRSRLLRVSDDEELAVEFRRVLRIRRRVPRPHRPRTDAVGAAPAATVKVGMTDEHAVGSVIIKLMA